MNKQVEIETHSVDIRGQTKQRLPRKVLLGRRKRFKVGGRERGDEQSRTEEWESTRPTNFQKRRLKDVFKFGCLGKVAR